MQTTEKVQPQSTLKIISFNIPESCLSHCNLEFFVLFYEKKASVAQQGFLVRKIPNQILIGQVIFPRGYFEQKKK